jgi:hypothetical protein
MQVNNPFNGISKEIISDTKNSVDTKEGGPNTKKSETESDECATRCGLCCICYLMCFSLFDSL